MKYKFTITVGGMPIEIEDEAINQAAFFAQIAPFSSIPRRGPKGFENSPLEFSRRVAQGEYDYYSIVCRDAGMEFKFGELKKNKGTLFPKGWQKIQYSLDRHDESDSEGGEPGEQWCEWCNDRPSAAGIPCQVCADLGANPRKEEPATIHQQTPAQPQSSNVTSINRPAADVPKINVDQFTKIESLMNDLASLNVSRDSILEKLRKQFSVTDLRQVTAAQADVAIKQMTFRLQEIEAGIRNKASQRVSA